MLQNSVRLFEVLSLKWSVLVRCMHLKIHTPLGKCIRSLGLCSGFDFELVGLSKPLSWAHYLKLYCDRQDSIVIETRDSIVW